MGEVSSVGHPGDCRCTTPGWPKSREWNIWWMRVAAGEMEVLLEVGGFDMDGDVEMTLEYIDI